jgi:hypothetical protein
VAVGIALTQGFVALVDEADADALAQWRWWVVRSGDREYAMRTGPRPERAVWLMHRVILGLRPGRTPEVDHINGDGLDNRRANLRVATHSQNMANQDGQRRRRGRFKGVSLQDGRWTARIRANGVLRYLGSFGDEEAAAAAYDVAAREAFGEFARTNEEIAS